MKANKLMATTLAMALMFGTTNCYSTDNREQLEPVPRPKGYDHKHKSEVQKQAHKEHQKKIKAKRKAKKGIYDHKIVYKKAKKLKEHL